MSFEVFLICFVRAVCCNFAMRMIEFIPQQRIGVSPLKGYLHVGVFGILFIWLVETYPILNVSLWQFLVPFTIGLFFENICWNIAGCIYGRYHPSDASAIPTQVISYNPTPIVSNYVPSQVASNYAPSQVASNYVPALTAASYIPIPVDLGCAHSQPGMGYNNSAHPGSVYNTAAHSGSVYSTPVDHRTYE